MISAKFPDLTSFLLTKTTTPDFSDGIIIENVLTPGNPPECLIIFISSA